MHTVIYLSMYVQFTMCVIPKKANTEAQQHLTNPLPQQHPLFLCSKIIHHLKLFMVCINLA